MPEVIKAEYRIVTPMFIGDANQQATGISPASVKGALRFWWRALNWGRIRSEANSDEAALKGLHKQEGYIFGSSAEQGAGQARFNLRVIVADMPKAKNDWPTSQSDSGYLGMGLWQSGKKEKGNFQPARQYLSENNTFIVKAVLHPSLKPEETQSIKDTLMIFGFLGGLGSRTRRAFGSVALLTMDSENYEFNSTDQYQAAIHALLSKYNLSKVQPPYTAFSQECLIGVNTQSKSTARLAHNDLGALFKQHRGQPSELRGQKKRVFGMPYSGGGSKENNARRASPLLMHIHPIENGFHAVSTFLPSTFHHDNALKKVDYSLVSGFVQQFEKVAIV